MCADLPEPLSEHIDAPPHTPVTKAHCMLNSQTRYIIHALLYYFFVRKIVERKGISQPTGALIFSRAVFLSFSFTLSLSRARFVSVSLSFCRKQHKSTTTALWQQEGSAFGVYACAAKSLW